MPNEPASQLARNFATLHHSAVLSTLDATGAPFGSVVNYVLSPAGHDLSPTRNLLRDPRASLLIAEFFSHDDPQAGASVLGRFEQARLDNSIADNSVALEQLRAHSLRRFPEAFLLGDFQFFQMVPERVRWIGGFGKIGWGQGAEFLAASEDPLAAELCGVLLPSTPRASCGCMSKRPRQAGQRLGRCG
jgi:putative heme iron utilization protein